MQGGHAARLLKIDMNITIYGTKIQNIDIDEHLHIKLWSESSISEVFPLIFLTILRKLGHVSNQR